MVEKLQDGMLYYAIIQTNKDKKGSVKPLGYNFKELHISV